METDALKLVTDSFSSIWNDRRAGQIYSLYLHNARIFTGLNDMIYGRENYLSRIISVHSMLPDLVFTIDHAFSDQPEENIDRVYLRWRLEGTHLGSGIFGEPSGRKLEFTGMTICHLRDGLIFEQRDVWNNGNICDQLGLPEEEFYPQFRVEPPIFDPVQFGETGRILGQDLPEAVPEPDGKAGAGKGFIFRLLHHIWNNRSPGIILRTHTEDCVFHLPGNRVIDTAGEYCEFVFSMISAFPDLRVYIDEIITDFKTETDSYAAARCTLQGFHGGSGRYGEPVNRQVTIPVIIEYQFENNKVKSEMLCMSEFDLIKYLYSYRCPETEAAGNSREDKVEE